MGRILNFFMVTSLPAQQGAVTEDTIKPHGLFNPAQTTQIHLDSLCIRARFRRLRREDPGVIYKAHLN